MSMNRDRKFLGLYVDELSKKMRKEVRQYFLEDGVDPLVAIHGWMIGYIYHSDCEVYQKDIEKVAYMSKSSVTAILKAMEREGYLRRISVKHDARLKKLVLTKKAHDMEKCVQIYIENTINRAVKGISEEQLETFLEVLTKMNQNFEEGSE